MGLLSDPTDLVASSDGVTCLAKLEEAHRLVEVAGNKQCTLGLVLGLIVVAKLLNRRIVAEENAS